MLTKDDKKFITDTVTFAIAKNNEVMIKEMLGLFDANNSAMMKMEDRLSKQISGVNDNLDTDERRIEKLEEKVFTISA